MPIPPSLQQRRQALAMLAVTPWAMAVPTAAQAQQASSCADIKGQGEVNLVGNAFPAIQHVAKRIEACNRPGLKVAFKITPQAREETERALAAPKSPFDGAVMSMGEFTKAQAAGQLQPMTDLVTRHKARFGIEENMLVRTNNEVMAVAFMQNAQCLFYRQDLFDKHKLAVPTTYAQLLEVAAALKAKEPGLDTPLAQTFAKGWDSATEFANLFVAFGGRFFKPGTAQPAFNDEAGVKAIDLMKQMTKFMTPNFLASNSDDVMNQFQQGRAAIGVLWASRAQRMDDPAASKVAGKMAFAPAPATTSGGRPATHLWWDGVVLPKHISADRDTVFQLLMHGLAAEGVATGNDLAIWVRSNYKPTRFGGGVAASAKAGAPVWPGEPFFALAHAEIGKLLPDALTGAAAPKAALDAAAAAYRKLAVEKGFLK
jgi:multiple sugar transport system substrate-binding protein